MVAALKLKVGVALAVRSSVSGVIATVRGTGCSSCSSITVTLALPVLATKALSVTGSTATATGCDPTETGVATLVAPSITVT